MSSFKKNNKFQEYKSRLNVTNVAFSTRLPSIDSVFGGNQKNSNTFTGKKKKVWDKEERYENYDNSVLPYLMDITKESLHPKESLESMDSLESLQQVQLPQNENIEIIKDV